MNDLPHRTGDFVFSNNFLDAWISNNFLDAFYAMDGQKPKNFSSAQIKCLC